MSDEMKSPGAIAYVLPFLLYVVPTTFETSNGLGMTYEFICTMKGILAAVALWKFQRGYPEFSTKGFALAVTTGGIGFLVWIGMERAQASNPAIKELSGWLLQGGRAGFDPFANDGPSIEQIAFVVVRLIEMSLVVPLIEELFWRGFLSRYLIAEEFQSVIPGTFTSLSFAIVTFAFTLVHPEILAAITWCAMINVLYWKTRNLWACVVMHAVTNGLLGFYVLMTKNWHLW